MLKYRVYTDNGYVEFLDLAKTINYNGSSDGIETIEFSIEITPTIDKRWYYQQNCDYITLEINRKKLLGILTDEEEALLLERLREETEKINCL